MRMERSKIGNFIESLGLSRIMAEVLFETWEDCELYLRQYHNRNALNVDDLLDFREAKIANSTIGLDTFVLKCKNNDLRTSFEQTFYQSFKQTDIEMIEKAIGTGRTSLENIFENFKNNPNKNILKYVL